MVICGIIIAGLGVLNDVTITQASAVWELADASRDHSKLFSRAMRIGRDHIASTVYTIAFATAGASLGALLLIAIYDRPLFEVLQTELFAGEIVRTLVGSIGLVLAVPLTTAIGVAVVRVGDRGAARQLGLSPAASGTAESVAIAERDEDSDDDRDEDGDLDDQPSVDVEPEEPAADTEEPDASETVTEVADLQPADDMAKSPTNPTSPTSSSSPASPTEPAPRVPSWRVPKPDPEDEPEPRVRTSGTRDPERSTAAPRERRWPPALRRPAVDAAPPNSGPADSPTSPTTPDRAAAAADPDSRSVRRWSRLRRRQDDDVDFSDLRAPDDDPGP